MTPPDEQSPGPTAATQQAARDHLLREILAAVTRDDRVLAALDYGSTSEGRGDAWSDIDLALAIRPEAWASFQAGWLAWLETAGPVLLGFTSYVGHPWAVLATGAAPVRVDLHLYGGPPDHDLASALDAWPNSPTSVAAMLAYDEDDRYRDEVAALVGRSLAPNDPAAAFADVAAHFWYYAHRSWSKLQRNSAWGVRWNVTFVLTGNLCALLRLESGATERWAASDAADGIEHAITPERLAALRRCIPGPDDGSLREALQSCVDLGADVCAVLAPRTGRDWPEELARQLRVLLGG